MVQSTDTGAFEQTVADTKQQPRIRIEAARKALWIAEKEWRLSENELLLARMILSRLLDGIDMRELASRDLVAAWKVTPLVSPQGPFKAAELSEAQALIVAKLLYDRSASQDAEPFFDRARGSHNATARTALLAAYNLERFGRLNRHAPSIDRALAILKEPDFDALTDADQAAAELKHCTGHLNILRAQFAKTPGGGYAQLGSDLLRQAADMDPVYTSCYTSSFAERGDYVGTIEASLEALQRRQFAVLPPRDSLVVALETIFYLAYALSCVGEYERARLCFAAFAERASDMGEYEARDHARLFMVKLDLKKRFSREISPYELSSYFQELRELSFRSPLSIPVDEETRRYEDVLEFLMALPSHLDGSELSEPGDYHGVPCTTSYFEMSEAYQAGRIALRRLTRERPNLSLESLGLLVSLGAEHAMTSVKECVAEFSMLWTVKPVAVKSELSRAVIENARPFDVLGIWVHDRADLNSALEVSEWLERTIPIYCQEPVAAVNAMVTSSEEDFRQILTIGAALALSKRFLLDDEYIFGLTPCTDSPATRFQHAEYSLAEIRN
jgi:hypothetical protein